MPASTLTSLVLTACELATLEGELLGDGSLVIGRRYTNARFQLQTAYQGQAAYAFAALHRLGGTPTRFIRKPGKFNKKPQTMWQSFSKRCPALSAVRSRWYVGKKKIVPADFVLSPLAALHWYVGDGSLHKQNPRIVFCTDGFDDLSVRRLLKQLELCGFRPRLRYSRKKHPRIELGVDDVAKWLSWIGPCPVPELSHKWAPTFRTRRNRYVQSDELLELQRLHNEGHTYREIADALGRPYHTVYSLLKKRSRK